MWQLVMYGVLLQVHEFMSSCTGEKMVRRTVASCGYKMTRKTTLSETGRTSSQLRRHKCWVLSIILPSVMTILALEQGGTVTRWTHPLSLSVYTCKLCLLHHLTVYTLIMVYMYDIYLLCKKPWLNVERKDNTEVCKSTKVVFPGAYPIHISYKSYHLICPNLSLF